MDKAEIERLVGERVRVAAEQAISDAIDELNANGHCFESVGETAIEWREPASQNQLNIYCTIGVSYGETKVLSPPQMEASIECFLQQAQSGNDQTATKLNQLEGSISNGGLYQTIENHGIGFLEECNVALKAIHANATRRIIEEALQLWYEHATTVQQYAELRKRLSKLDRRFWKLKESIAKLYQRNHSSVKK